MPNQRKRVRNDGRVKNAQGIPGSVREHPPGSGRWQARFPRAWGTTKSGERLSHPDNPFDSEQAAWDALSEAATERSAIDQAARQSARRAAGEPPIYTVREMCRDYIRERSNHPTAHIGQRTKDGYYQALRDQILDPDTRLGNQAADKVTGDDIEAWRTALQNSPRQHQAGKYKGQPFHAESSIERAGRLLAAAFNWAYQNNTVDRIPAVNPRAPRSKFAPPRAAKRRRPVFPTWAEVASIIAHPHRQQDRLLLALLAWGGLRWSEAIGLACSDVDQRVPQVWVSRVFVRAPIPRDQQVIGPNGKPLKKRMTVEEPVKTGVVESVPLPDQLYAGLRDLDRSRHNSPDELLFHASNYRDAPSTLPLINESGFRKSVWVPAIAAAGVPGMQIKDLRSYAASALVDAGATEVEAQLLLRHSDAKTTREHYTVARNARSGDRDRAKLPPVKATDTLQERLTWLFDEWLNRFPEAKARLLDTGDDDVRVGASTRPRPRDLGKVRAWARSQGLPGVSQVGNLRREIVEAYLAEFPDEAVQPDISVSGYMARKEARQLAREAARRPVRPSQQEEG